MVYQNKIHLCVLQRFLCCFVYFFHRCHSDNTCIYYTEVMTKLTKTVIDLLALRFSTSITYKKISK